MSPSHEEAFLRMIRWTIAAMALGLFTSLTVIAVGVAMLVDRLGGTP